MKFAFPDRFSRRCFCCGATPAGPFTVDVDLRHCATESCPSKQNWRPSEGKLLASVLPEWEQPRREAFPGILQSEAGFGSDGSIIWADSSNELPGSHNAYGASGFDLAAWERMFPFESNFLAGHGLRLGHPFAYRGKRLQHYAESTEVYVLDMGSYYWSGTLKDPRVWSCVNLAIEKRLRILWAWTSGNAGLALARIATAANAFLLPSERLYIYLFYDETDTAMQKDVLPLLREAGASLIPVANPREGVYSPEDLLKKIGPTIDRAPWNEIVETNAFWDITDGWDGSGCVDYRRVFLQAFLRLQPEHVVMPLGTGNLLVGALLAGRDYKALTGRPAPRCVCGVPYDRNIVMQIAAAPGFTKSKQLRGTVRIAGGTGGVRRWTPKVAGYYSALLACVEHAIRTKGVQVFGIDKKRLRESYRAVCEPGQVTQPRHIRSEPSSAVAFGAYRDLVSEESAVADQRVLVVNTGCGIMGAAEVSFVRDIVGS